MSQTHAEMIADLKTLKAGLEDARVIMAQASAELGRLQAENARMAAALKELREECEDRYDGAPDAGATAVWIGQLLGITRRGLGDAPW